MRLIYDIKIGELTLAEILENHQHWINEDRDGWEDLRANLYRADLHGANLYGADLHGADLHGADLHRADLYMACPTDGAFIGWKKVKMATQIHGIYSYLIKLEIPEDAKRSSATTHKCRCDKAKVLEIYRIDDELILMDPDFELINTNYVKTTYKVGEMVYPDSFDEDRFNECSNGIHFFIDKQEAINY